MLRAVLVASSRRLLAVRPPCLLSSPWAALATAATPPKPGKAHGQGSPSPGSTSPPHKGKKKGKGGRAGGGGGGHFAGKKGGGGAQGRPAQAPKGKPPQASNGKPGPTPSPKGKPGTAPPPKGKPGKWAGKRSTAGGKKQQPMAARKAGAGGTSTAFPTLVDTDTFARMREQFARIREERQAREAEGDAGRGPVPGRREPSFRRPRRRRFGNSPRVAAVQRPRPTRPPRIPRSARPVLYRVVEVGAGMTPRSLALAMAVRIPHVMRKLRDLGEDVEGIDSELDPDVAEVVVTESGQDVRRVDAIYQDVRPVHLPVSAEEAARMGVTLEGRPPVLTVMGHVDHGKTTLLDAFRSRAVADKEAGGITQAISAFSAPFGEGTATFLDTPGHVLFSAMRRRGTAVADVALIVVAAEDGVMPQTKEAVDLVLDKDLQAVVVVTKVDLVRGEGTDTAPIEQQLLELGLATEAFGGDVPVVPVSAKTGFGLDTLQEIVGLQAEVMELEAAPDADGQAVVLEATTGKGLGNVVDVVVRWGTLRVGSHIVVGDVHGRIKAMIASDGSRVKAATPGAPIRVVGLSALPPPGADLLTVPTEAEAKRIVDGRKRRGELKSLIASNNAIQAERATARRQRMAKLERQRRLRLVAARDSHRRRLIRAGEPVPDHLVEQEWERVLVKEELAASKRGRGRPVEDAEDAEAEEAVEVGPVQLNVVLRADTQGSLDAMADVFGRVPDDKAVVRVVQQAVGDVTTGDVDLAGHTDAVVLAFNVKASNAIQKTMEKKKIVYRRASVIYGLADHLSELISARLPARWVEEELGRADVKEVYPKRDGLTVAGCVVTGGEMRRGVTVRVVREGVTLWEGPAASLRRFQDTVSSVAKGTEFGLAFDCPEVISGDTIVAITLRKEAVGLSLKL